MRSRDLGVALAAVLVLLIGTGVIYALTQFAAQNTGEEVPGKERLKALVQPTSGFASVGLVKGITGNWDRHMSRRAFLKMSGMGTAALLLGGLSGGRVPATRSNRPDPSYPSMNYPSPDYLFKLGVASGDPLPDGSVLWTRLAPDPLNGGGMPQRNVPVRWEVASDENMSRIVRSGTAYATPGLAHSVHVEVGGLEPGRFYWYRFEAGDDVSPTGRTKTAPALGSRLDAMTFAFASCQNWEAGYYPAYRTMAQEENLDLVFHLGDYIYQWAPMTGVVRHCDGGKLKALSDYRNRHALYKTDPDLQAAHAAHPWVVTWDNHDGWSNYAGLCDDDKRSAASTALRDAYQAYYEHMPLRLSARPRGGKHSSSWRLYRRLDYGDLARFNVLDTRTHRTLPESYGVDSRPATPDKGATMTGKEQERWLLKGLDAFEARWNVIAQQVMMAQLNQDPNSSDGAFDLEAWDGYVAQRGRILDHLSERRTPNPIVISGDMHTSWVSDLKADFDEPSSASVGTEFVGTSVSSNCADSSVETYQKALDKNPHVGYFDARKGGYVRCEITPEHWCSDLRVADSVLERQSPVRTIASFVVDNGRPGAVQV
jgi:alkaline phosphatase D